MDAMKFDWNKLRIFLCFTLFINSCVTFSQTERGILFQSNAPKELDQYFTIDSLLKLEHVRSVSDLLTNPYASSFEGLLLPKRKKAVARHIKQINEELERAWIDQRKRDRELNELVGELELYRLSFLQKAQNDQTNVLTFGDKWSLYSNTVKSKRKLKVYIPKVPSFIPDDPYDSPYWHTVSDTIQLEFRFDQLAKEKKFKARDKMVVLAKDFSNSGSGAKIEVFDLDLDNEWILKWGDEVHSDVFSSRLFASMGYDVDHPYHYAENLFLVFDDTTRIHSPERMYDSLIIQYGIDIRPFVFESGIIGDQQILLNKKLEPFKGKSYLRFVDCALEARPDRVKRLGSIVPNDLNNDQRLELKAAILLHQFIGNWDTREVNTAMTNVHMGSYNYRPSAIFSDLGTSMGVKVSWLHQDFKAGLVNELDWKAVKRKGNKLVFTTRINEVLSCYDNANFEELLWMAQKIAGIDEKALRSMLHHAHWPPAIEELYFHKMASRRESILNSFGIKDPHPIKYDSKLTIVENGNFVVKKGKLVMDLDTKSHPEGFTGKKGRRRNYGKKL